MPCITPHEHARRQAAMWTRLAEQCRRCGDHDLEQDARRLSRHYRSLAEVREPGSVVQHGQPRNACVAQAEPM